MEPHTHNGVDSPIVDAGTISGLYTGSTAVLKTTDQTVAGVKTFSSIPVLPASNPTTDNQLVRKAYADALDVPAYDVVATDDVLRDSADTLDTTTNTDPFKKKDITYNGPNGSTIRVKFYLQSLNGDENAHGRIYKNGVAVGTERITKTYGSDPELDWEKYSEDIDVDNGDEVQLYLWRTNDGLGDTARCKNFRLYYKTTITDITAGTVNLD
jgi:hypothetical protein